MHRLSPFLLSCLLLAACSKGNQDSGDQRLRAMSTAAEKAHATAAPMTFVQVKISPARPRLPPIRIDGIVQVTPASGDAQVFAKTEWLISLGNVHATKPYEPNPGYGGLDLYAQFTPPGASSAMRINGFYDGSSWRIRFAPTVIGTWTYTVTARDSSGSATSALRTLNVLSSTSRGFARATSTSTHLSFSGDGSAFFGIGHNTGWQYEVRTPGFAQMVANGENLLSFWLAVPWARPSESPEPWRSQRAALENRDSHVGTYQQDACQYLDAVIADAEAHGVSVLPSLWSHGQLRSTTGHPWGAGWYETYNPYYADLGVSASDFFLTTTSRGADTTQWRYQKNYLRYLQARWGHSTALVGWVTVVELEGCSGWIVNPTQATTWCSKVSQWFRDNDPYRTVIAAGGSTKIAPVGTSRSDSANWNAPGDLRTADSYQQQRYDTAGSTPVAHIGDCQSDHDHARIRQTGVPR